MAGGEVATVLNLDPILAVGEVSERDLGYLKIGDEADIRLVDGQTVKGKVRYISRDASAQTRTFRIEVAIPNGTGAIPAGMTAEIMLRAVPTDAVILPRSVVTLSGNGDLGIRAVDKDNKVTFHPIDLVDDTPTGLVLGGIPTDARIIVAGQDLVTRRRRGEAVEADAETVKRLVDEAHRRHTVGLPIAMDIVGYAIRNARLTLSIMIFFLIAGALCVSVDAEGSRAGVSRFRSCM